MENYLNYPCLSNNILESSSNILLKDKFFLLEILDIFQEWNSIFRYIS